MEDEEHSLGASIGALITVLSVVLARMPREDRVIIDGLLREIEDARYASPAWPADHVRELGAMRRRLALESASFARSMGEDRATNRQPPPHQSDEPAQLASPSDAFHAE